MIQMCFLHYYLPKCEHRSILFPLQIAKIAPPSATYCICAYQQYMFTNDLRKPYFFFLSGRYIHLQYACTTYCTCARSVKFFEEKFRFCLAFLIFVLTVNY
jgi:hypothetical protein